MNRQRCGIEEGPQIQKSKTWFLCHCIALRCIMFAAKSLILWVNCPHLKDEGVKDGCSLLGLGDRFLTNMSNGFRVWKVQVQTPTSSGVMNSFESPAFYSVAVEITASPVGPWGLNEIELPPNHSSNRRKGGAQQVTKSCLCLTSHSVPTPFPNGEAENLSASSEWA